MTGRPQDRSTDERTTGDRTHFVDRLPFDWSLPESQELRDLLAQSYFQPGPVIAMAGQAGIHLAAVNWQGPMTLVWHDLITTARRQDKLRDLLDQVEAGPDQAVALRLRELLLPRPVLGASEPLSDQGDWADFTDPDAQERQILDAPSLLDISFLRRGVELAPTVARLLVRLTDGRQYYGTAFRIGDDILLTNHHVLFYGSTAAAQVAAVEAWFGYETDFGGRYLAHRTIVCAPESIAGNRSTDWAVIRTRSPMPSEAPRIELPRHTSIATGDRVYIIQHPSGGPKKVGLHSNVVRHVDGRVVQYWSHTEQGSSGAPVFDQQWNLVALHHRWIRTGPLSGPPEYRNQGIRIERVREELANAGWL
ncbi:serine protease [Streptomyces canus]|uniref:trypsin-like peptidase domain-containing protein n=1 Tax=Streptomyces canus TaxID=58343 RepID=UPI002E2B2706|nr:trypsin-like peptidase domain-containing protein [Streptomyces canus]